MKKKLYNCWQRYRNKRIIKTYERGKKKFYINLFIIVLISPPLGITLAYIMGVHPSLFMIIFHMIFFYFIIGFVFFANAQQKWEEIEKVYKKMNDKNYT